MSVIYLKKDWWAAEREPMRASPVIKRKPKLPGRLMTVKEVANCLGCGIWLVYDLLRDGEIDWQPVGRRGKRISEEALLEYLERRRAEERRS